MRTVGQDVGKMRRMAAEFQGQFMDAMREEADLESVKKELEALERKGEGDTSFDPARLIRDDVTKAVERPTASDVDRALANAATPEPAGSTSREAGDQPRRSRRLTERSRAAARDRRAARPPNLSRSAKQSAAE